ncbi:hypothetical protein PYCC9005_002728 [Savitreella phatthalungensis]
MGSQTDVYLNHRRLTHDFDSSRGADPDRVSQSSQPVSDACGLCDIRQCLCSGLAVSHAAFDSRKAYQPSSLGTFARELYQLAFGQMIRGQAG